MRSNITVERDAPQAALGGLYRRDLPWYGNFITPAARSRMKGEANDKTTELKRSQEDTNR